VDVVADQLDGVAVVILATLPRPEAACSCGATAIGEQVVAGGERGDLDAALVVYTAC